jgi:branched-chain amino acid:cation transporter, LIVCS family
MKPIVSFYENTLPFYNQGLGWLVPVLMVMIVTGILGRAFNLSIVPVYKKVTS